MKYAVEVAKVGSLNRASEALLVAPPNLSRCIKELEADLGVVIFDRTSRGMTLTKPGEEFIHYARKILDQIDEVENVFKDGKSHKRQFSISVPRASYIAEALVEFTKNVGDESIEIFYKETNPYRTLKNILELDYNLGIVRYSAKYSKYFTDTFAEKGLYHELVVQFHYVLTMSRRSPLALKKEVRLEDLEELIEIVHGDPFVPSLPPSIVRKEELSDNIERRIFVFGRGTQFDLLAENPMTFMWVSPIPDSILKRNGLVQKECPENIKAYKDVLIYRNGYVLSDLDKLFTQELRKSIQNNFF